MNDTIYRQAAIDALANNMPSLTTPDGCGQFDHDIQVTDETYVDCMQIIHELPSAQPKWIPCEKGLPGIREEVIATDGAFVYVASRCWYPDTNATVWENSDGWTIDAKAWMPLPEPYKGERK